MHDDEMLKALLMKGGMEQASPGFTDKVMTSIKQAGEAKSLNSPLVPAYWIRVYRITFFAVVTLLLVVSLMLEFAALPITLQWKVPPLLKEYSTDAAFYIVAFWSLLWAMYVINKQPTNSTS